MKFKIPRLPLISKKRVEPAKLKYAESLKTILSRYMGNKEIASLQKEEIWKAALERNKENDVDIFTLQLQTDQTSYFLEIKFNSPSLKKRLTHHAITFSEAHAFWKDANEPSERKHLDLLVAERQRKIKLQESQVPSYDELDKLAKQGRSLEFWNKLCRRPFPTIEAKDTPNSHQTAVYIETWGSPTK
jgi:hypothetical protein